jgi:hypothetical protein
VEDPDMEDPDMGMGPDITRIISVVDAKGREHECILVSFIAGIAEEESDLNQGKHWVWIVFLSLS